MPPSIRKPIIIRNSFLTCNGYILRTRVYFKSQPGPHGIFVRGIPPNRNAWHSQIPASQSSTPKIRKTRMHGFHPGPVMMGTCVIWRGAALQGTVLATIFSAPSQQWNYDNSGPEIRSGRTHCGREMASLTLQEPTGEYPCVMYSLIENTLVSNYTHLQSLSNQSSAYS